MFAVDANLLTYAAMYDAPEHERAQGWLRECARGTRPWFATRGTPYEFLRVTTRRRAYAHPLTFDQAVAFTADADFHRFRELRVVNPLAG